MQIDRSHSGYIPNFLRAQPLPLQAACVAIACIAYIRFNAPSPSIKRSFVARWCQPLTDFPRAPLLIGALFVGIYLPALIVWGIFCHLFEIGKPSDQELMHFFLKLFRNRGDFSKKLEKVGHRPLQDLLSPCLAGLREALGSGSDELQITLSLGGSSLEVSFNLKNSGARERCEKFCAQGERFVECIPAIEPPPPLDGGDFVEVDPSYFNRVEGCGVELWGKNGADMRLMAFRAALKEYVRILEGQGIALDATLGELESWDSPPESIALLRTALEILRDVDQSNNFEKSYTDFVDAHRALIAFENKAAQVERISHAIATARFTANMQGFFEEFVKQHIHWKEEPLTRKNFVAHFKAYNAQIKVASPVMKMGFLAENWRRLAGLVSCIDFFKNPDVPNLLGTSHWEKGREKWTILYLRHPTPPYYKS